MRVSDLIFANLRDALLLNPLFPLRHFAPFFGLSELRLPVRNCGPITIRTGNSDAGTLRSIFRDLGYDISGFKQAADIMAAYNAILTAGQIPVIIDAGANIGGASIWFAKFFSRSHVISVEPEPRNAELCRRNTAHIPNIQLVEAALGASSGHSSIANEAADSWAFSTTRNENGSIPIVTIPELAAAVPNGQLFAAKIDIEGFESDLFSQNTSWLYNLKFLFIEPHDWLLPNQGTSRAFQTCMAQGNFELLIAGENLLYVAVEPAVALPASV